MRVVQDFHLSWEVEQDVKETTGSAQTIFKRSEIVAGKDPEVVTSA